jgi:hypothetical protein
MVIGAGRSRVDARTRSFLWLPGTPDSAPLVPKFSSLDPGDPREGPAPYRHLSHIGPRTLDLLTLIEAADRIAACIKSWPMASTNLPPGARW